MGQKKLYDYSVKSSSSELIETEIFINHEHHVFEGHFPGVPILPGVCQLEMIKQILCEEKGQKLTLSSAKSIKFLSMLNPKETKSIVATIKIKETELGINVNAELFDSQTKYLKLSAEYCERP